MKKFIYLFTFIALVFNACTKNYTFNEKIPVNFVFELSSNGNSMTKSNADIFDEFYANLENGNLVAESYSLTLTNIETGVKHDLNGVWKKHSVFNIDTGKYKVTGVSIDDNSFIQETCSFRFDEVIEINSETTNVSLSAIYNSFLLIFIGNDIVEVNNYSGNEVKSFYDFNGYKYAFVNQSLVSNSNDEAYIEVVFTNGFKTKCYTKDIKFEKGKYYTYTCLSNGIIVPKMEQGNTEFEQETVSNVVQVFNDSLYVNMLSAGTLYPLYKTKVTGKETNSEWGEEVWNNITHVKIVGKIDARDFSTLKWNFRNLTNLDISETTIVAYSGLYGTVEGYEYSYNADAIPLGAFFYWQWNNIRDFPNELYDEGMKTLKHIKLPSNINWIERNAFARAYNLEDIEIPEGVISIDMCAFRHCRSIKKMYVPEKVQTIGMYAFTDMNSLSEIHFKSKTLPYYHNTAFGFYNDGTNTDYFDEIKTDRGYVLDSDYLKYNDVTLYVPEGYKNVYTEWNNYFKEITEE